MPNSPSNSDKQAFRMRLKRLNFEAGEPRLEDISKVTGISPASLSYYFNGRVPKKESIRRKLADYYGVSVDELFSHESVKNVNEDQAAYGGSMTQIESLTGQIVQASQKGTEETRGWVLVQLRKHVSPEEISEIDQINRTALEPDRSDEKPVAPHLRIRENPDYRPKEPGRRTQVRPEAPGVRPDKSHEEGKASGE